MKAAKYDHSGNGHMLNSSVLVLNKHFSAIRVISVRRAFTLLCKNAAEVMDKTNGHYDTYGFTQWVKASVNGHNCADAEFVHTPTINIKVPRVIRLVVYDKFRRTVLRITRRNILARDDNHCQYCGKKLPVAKLSIDHIMPRSRGGMLTWDNVVTCCSKCNTRKGGHLPHEVGMVLMRQPQVPTQDPLIPLHIKDDRYALWQDFVTGSASARQ